MGRRFLSRFAIVYVWLYWLPTPFDAIPVVGDYIWQATEAVWRPPVELLGRALSLQVPPQVLTGSGDTLAGWLQWGCVLLLSLTIGFIWSFEQRRTRDEALLDLTRDYLRLALAATMMIYGTAKVSASQFAALDHYTLFQSYGDSSPMGLLWRFMGFSGTYQRFTGWAEVLGGVLLVMRRTTTLGALVSAGVMANVVMLNFCFDVPVKLASTHLLVFSLALAAPDAGRLGTLLFTQQGVFGSDHRNRYALGRARFVMPVLTVVFISMQLVTGVQKRHDIEAASNPLYGSYVVKRQTGEDDAWHTLQIEEERIAYKRGDELWISAPAIVDLSAKTITVKTNVLTWSAERDAIVVSGKWDGHDLGLTLTKQDPAKQPLLTRGFHWVQEFPFNK